MEPFAMQEWVLLALIPAAFYVGRSLAKDNQAVEMERARVEGLFGPGAPFEDQWARLDAAAQRIRALLAEVNLSVGARDEIDDQLELLVGRGERLQ